VSNLNEYFISFPVSSMKVNLSPLKIYWKVTFFSMPFKLSVCANQTPCMFAWSVDLAVSPSLPHDEAQTRSSIMRQVFINIIFSKIDELYERLQKYGIVGVQITNSFFHCSSHQQPILFHVRPDEFVRTGQNAKEQSGREIKKNCSIPV